MTINSDGTKYSNASMNMENCTCNMYAPRLSNTSQEPLRPIKRDACTSPTIPTTSNLNYSTRKGTFMNDRFRLKALDGYKGYVY